MGEPEEQATVGSGTGGGPWVRLQPVLDRMFTAVEDLLVGQVAEVAPATAPTVIDVGCGTGATTLALARRLGPGSRCTGVDVSEEMTAVARRRAAGEGLDVDFVVADAQRHGFAAGAADVVASRFGVMFFDDPVAAFANLRAATRDEGSLRAVVWRGPGDNPFMTRAEEAAADVLALPPRPADGPGQFGLADRDRTRGVLVDAGWSDVGVEPVDLGCRLSADELDTYLGHMGPVGRVLAGCDDEERARLVEHVRPAFDPFRHGDEVRFTAACWLLTGSHRPSGVPPSR